MAWWRLSFLRGTSEKRPVLLEIRSSSAFILTAVSIAIFTDTFLYGIIVPVMPFALTVRVGIDPSKVQYWVSVMLAVYGACLLAPCPLWGWISDRSSTRRAPLLFGLLLLTGATIMLTLGKSIGVLMAGRALQGLAAAVVWITGLALLVDTLGKDHIGESMGYVTMAFSSAVLLAPMLGGVVFNRAGYYAVYAMGFALLGVDIFLRLVMIEKKVAAKWITVSNTDATLPDQSDEAECQPSNEKVTTVKESPLSTSSAFPADNTATADNTEASSQSSPRNALVRNQSFASSLRPTVPPLIKLLKSPRMLVAFYGAFVQASLLLSFDAVLPIFVRQVFGWDSLGAGLIFLPFVIPTFLSPLAGWISDKYGTRWIAAAGFLFVVPFLVMLRLVTHNSINQKVLLCALLALNGLGIACALPPIMAEITYVVSEKEQAHPGYYGERGAYAQAFGLFNMSFAAGAILGPLWAGLIKQHAGWGTMAWTLALLSGTTSVPILLLMDGWLFGRKRTNKRVGSQPVREEAAETV